MSFQNSIHMTKNKETLGIDLNKNVFDVYDYQMGCKSFTNDGPGNKSFLNAKNE